MRLLHITYVMELLMLVMCGCQHVRTAAIVDVPGPSAAVQTKYRYSVRLRRNGSSYNGNLLFKLHQPYVFAEDGVPVDVVASTIKRESYGKSDAARTAQFLLYMCSCGLAPIFNGNDAEESVSISIPLAGDRPLGSLKVATQYDEAVSIFSPIALCLYRGEASFPQFGAGSSCVFKNNRDGIGGQFVQTRDSEALAYGIACRLKDMEDKGIVSDKIVMKHRLQQGEERQNKAAAARQQQMLREQKAAAVRQQQNVVYVRQIQPQQTTPAKSLCSFTRFTWDGDFAAVFSAKLNDVCSPDQYFAIDRNLEVLIREKYLREHPIADARLIQVYVRTNLEDGKISGRAAVLTIAPVSLSYDANTRRGKLSVRFNAGQAEEARAWIRKNIETLARDKNIALTTGQPPPAATYYSLGERIDGNVMEIEFRTE